MITMNDVLMEVTSDFISQLVISSVSDLDDIEHNLLSKVHEAIDEHNTICQKDDKWKKPKYLEYWQISEIMRKIFSIRNIRCCPQNTDEDSDLLGIYVDDFVVSITNDDTDYGIYVTNENVLKTVAKKFKRGLLEKEQNELLSDIKMYAQRTTRCDDRDLIAVNNGIFHYDTKQLEDFSPEYVFLTKSHVNYNHGAVSPVIKMPNGDDWEVKAWMNDLNDDPEITNLFWEITSALLRPNVRWNKAAMLMSNTGNNGKGTLVEMWRALLGDGVHTAIPLSDFGKDFMLEPLIRASAIITDENDVGGFLDKAANLKAVITNDVIQINRKFKAPISYQVHGFMVQCLNEIPRIKDKSDSFFRRQLFIPMTKCFTGMEIPEIKNDYLHRKEVLEYVMKEALETNFYKLSEPESCKIALDDFKEFNDPVRQFWGELRDEFKWDLLPFSFLYDLFVAWSSKNNPSGRPMSNVNFNNDLLSVIKNDDSWICLDRKRLNRVTKTNMASPEPLILQYNLDDWKSNYKGSNKLMKAKPDNLANSYRGILRINPIGSDTDEE